MSNASIEDFDARKYVRGQYMRQSDIPESGWTLTIKFAYVKTNQKTFIDEVFLTFNETHLHLKMNKYRFESLIDLHGFMSANWCGKKVSLLIGENGSGGTGINLRRVINP